MADEEITSAENPEAAVEDDPFVVRRAKLDALRAAGQQPYLDSWDVTARAAQLEADYAGLETGAETEDVVSVAGRVVAKRDQGKVIFLVIRDATGDLQLFTRINIVGEDAFEAIRNLDLGDWVGAVGAVLRTRRGELSVAPTAVTLLSKSLRPLPDKHSGLSDTETRYRQRYVDLIVNPEVRDVFTTRFKIVAAIRRYMEEQGYLEVETPMLHPIPGGATAKPFVTHHNALDMEFYLRIAPELYLKRLLVGGFERVYEINRSFRNEGISVRHNPEFTMLEAYEAFGNMNSMMDLTEGIIISSAQQVLGTLDIT
ncbi:MAG: OB-fold nucleic acid binding domain-containing protein [Coriobacteriia bacterium]|nr:OB-fold nucleic acid binding domain-containing protein [Coriobacteriia bacterium]